MHIVAAKQSTADKRTPTNLGAAGRLALEIAAERAAYQAEIARLKGVIRQLQTRMGDVVQAELNARRQAVRHKRLCDEMRARRQVTSFGTTNTPNTLPALPGVANGAPAARKVTP